MNKHREKAEYYLKSLESLVIKSQSQGNDEDSQVAVESMRLLSQLAMAHATMYAGDMARITARIECHLEVTNDDLRTLE